MLDRLPPSCLEDLALPSAAAGFACPAGAPSQALLDEAATHFVRLRSRIGEGDDLLAEWLERSPCHRCAWRRIARVWDLAGDAPRPA